MKTKVRTRKENQQLQNNKNNSIYNRNNKQRETATEDNRKTWKQVKMSTNGSKWNVTLNQAY